MPSLLFWNVQRLGARTDAEIQQAINRIAAAQEADYEIYCELTTTCTVMPPVNLTYRLENPSQLCYGARDKHGNHLPMIRLEPTVADDYSTEAALARYGGDQTFRNWNDRAPADLGQLDGVHVYAFHAPAYALGGERSVAYLACYLNTLHGGDPWLLIGDMNVAPEQLADAPVGIGLADYILCTGMRTHQFYGEYDYALTNVEGMQIHTVRANRGFQWSDHYAIWVEW